MLVGGFAQRLVGYSTSEGVDLLRILQNTVIKPDNTVRWNWTTGDLVIWDNRATVHYATSITGKAHRQMQRVTTVGSVPVGVDGRTSKALVGDSTSYNAEAREAA